MPENQLGSLSQLLPKHVAQQNYHMQSNYQLLAPEDESGSIISGFVGVNGFEYSIRISGIKVEQLDENTCTEWPNQNGESSSSTKISSVASRPLSDAQLETCENLAQLLQEPLALTSRLRLARSIDHFIVELQDLIQNAQATLRSVASKNPLDSLPSTAFYERIISELDTIGWKHLIDINEMMTQISLFYLDSEKRAHIIGFEIQAQYPQSAPTIRHELPVRFKPAWKSQQNKCLSTIISAFQSELTRLQIFWNDMDEIDKLCWVQEPEKVKKKHTYRRIVVARHCSITIEICDPYHPRKVPKYCFLGADNLVAKHRACFSSNIDDWNENISIMQNLKTLLQLELPSKSTSKAADYILRCGICYSYRLSKESGKKIKTTDKNTDCISVSKKARISKSNTHIASTKSNSIEGSAAIPNAEMAAALFEAYDDEAMQRDVNQSTVGPGHQNNQTHTAGGIASLHGFATPDQICDNSRCGKSFHHACLLEWLRSTPSTRKSFRTYFGTCPYCSSPISLDTLKS